MSNKAIEVGLEPCPACQKLISTQATACPSCGHPTPRPRKPALSQDLSGFSILAGLEIFAGGFLLLWLSQSSRQLTGRDSMAATAVGLILLGLLHAGIGGIIGLLRDIRSRL